MKEVDSVVACERFAGCDATGARTRRLRCLDIRRRDPLLRSARSSLYTYVRVDYLRRRRVRITARCPVVTLPPRLSTR